MQVDADFLLVAQCHLLHLAVEGLRSKELYAWVSVVQEFLADTPRQVCLLKLLQGVICGLLYGWILMQVELLYLASYL